MRNHGLPVLLFLLIDHCDIIITYGHLFWIYIKTFEFLDGSFTSCDLVPLLSFVWTCWETKDNARSLSTERRLINHPIKKEESLIEKIWMLLESGSWSLFWGRCLSTCLSKCLGTWPVTCSIRHVPKYMLKHGPEYMLKHVPKHVLRHMPDKHVLALADRGGEGVCFPPILADVICEQLVIQVSSDQLAAFWNRKLCSSKWTNRWHLCLVVSIKC